MVRQTACVCFSLFLIVACQIDEEEEEVRGANPKVDTLHIVENFYSIRNEFLYSNRLLFIRERKADTLTFIYQDTVVVNQKKDTVYEFKYQFLEDGYQFRLLNPTDLIITDTLHLDIAQQSIDLYKYEIEAPPVDGEGGVLFSPEYGRVASVAFTWGNKSIVVEWPQDTLNVFDRLVPLLLTDSLKYLKPLQPGYD